MINVNYGEYLLPSTQYCIYYLFIPFMKMFVHSKLMVFFLTSCHLAYELCLDSCLETKLDAFDEKTLTLLIWWGRWGESVFVPLCSSELLGASPISGRNCLVS